MSEKSAFEKIKKKTASPTPPGALPESFTRSLDDNIAVIKKLFKSDETLIIREFSTSSPFPVKCAAVFIESMTDEMMISEFLIKGVVAVKSAPGKDPLEALVEKRLRGSDVALEDDPSKIIVAILSGSAALFAEGSYKAVVADTKGYQSRSVTEPENEKLLRGPREGFTEKMNTNISLIRRRLLTTDLKIRMFTFGRRTNTTVAICYLESLTEPSVIETLCERLSKIDIDGVLDSNYLEEQISDAPSSPFRTVGSTERPDTAVARMLEGRVTLLVNGSPTALTVPFVFIENFQSGDDYYSSYTYTILGRLLRFLGFFLAISVPAIYVSLLTFHRQMMPTNFALSIVAAREGVPFPVMVECIGLLLVFEILRETAVRMPSVVGQAMSIVGAIVIGESAVSAKIVSAPMVIVVGITALTSLMIPRLKSAVLYYWVVLLFCSGFIGLYGYIFGCLLMVIRLLSMKSFGVNYVSYLISADFQQMKDTLIRVPWRLMLERPRGMAKELPRQKSGDGK